MLLVITKKTWTMLMNLFNNPNENFHHSIIYRRCLGWNEFNQDGNSVPAMILVCDANIGYTVFRAGNYLELIEWFMEREDALDFSCDLSRRDISEHELRQSERGSDDAIY